MHDSLISWMRKRCGQSIELKATNLPAWDGWRGLAIGCVLVGHFMHTTSIKEDRLGVDMFFALSGMLMAWLLFEKRMPLSTFYVRRFSRVYPTLFIYVCAVFGIAASAGWSFTSLEVLTNLTFLRTYVPADPHIWSGAVPVKNLWSLNVEEHAYVFMSMLAVSLMAVRRVSLILMITGVLAVLISLYYNMTQDYNETYFLLRTECAISSIVLSAAWRLTSQARQWQVPGWLPALATVLAAVCYLEVLPLWTSFVFPPLLLAIAVNHVADSARFIQSVLGFVPLRLLGLWSYSIYLWQQPVYEYKWAVPGPSYGLPLIAALLLGYLSYTFLELPLREWINRRWAARSLRRQAV